MDLQHSDPGLISIGVPSAAQIIAETGHPQFPGWEVIAFLLMLATLAVAISGQQNDPARRRTGAGGRMPIIRVVKGTRGLAHGVRGLEAA